MKNYAARIQRASVSTRSSVDLLIGPVVIALALLFSLLHSPASLAQSGTYYANGRVYDSLGRVVGHYKSGLDGIARSLASPSDYIKAGVVTADGAGGAVLTNSAKLVVDTPIKKAVELGVSDVVRVPRSSLKGLATNAWRLTPQGLVGGILLTAAIDYGMYVCNQPGGWCIKDTPAPNTMTGRVCNTAGYQCIDNITYQGWVLNYRPTATDFQPINCLDGAACLSARLQYRWNGNWYDDDMRMSSPAGAERAAVPDDAGKAVDAYLGKQPATAADILKQIGMNGQYQGAFDGPFWEGATGQFNASPVTVGPMQVSSTTSPHGDGSTDTTTVTKSSTVTPGNSGTSAAGNNLTFNVTTTTTNSVTNSTTNNTTTSTTTETQKGAGTDAPLPCGLGIAGSPACKIDEAGTPTAQSVETQSSTATAMDAAMKQQTDALKSVLDGTKPETNWLSWLPVIPRSECKPTQVEAVPGNFVSIDWCPAVETMKVLATVIWAFTIMGACVAEVKDALNGS